MAERVVRNVENDYLMCSICLGRYRDPRLLPCGHTFCKQCLEDHIRQTVANRGSAYFTCPNDRTQISRPSPGVVPKEWAAMFPVDTFLNSLLSAVMIHASNLGGEDTSRLMCESHKGRLKEFFCLCCLVAACPYCVVKSHKGSKCECISVEEAVEKYRPKIEILRVKLQKQMQQARHILQSEGSENSALKLSREHAMSDLTDLETKLTFFYQTAMKQLKDMKNTIKETGNGKLTENQQVSVISENMNKTFERFEEVCNHGSGLDILNMVSKIEDQVKEYDDALRTLVHTPAMEVHFAVNHDLERVFENAPALGSVVVRGKDVRRPQQSFNSVLSAVPFLATPRGEPLSARSMATPRTGRSEFGRHSSESTLTPQRAKLSFSVKTPDTSISCWQLTGIAIIDEYVIVTDAHNGLIFKFEIQHAASVYDQLSLDCPVCVSGISDSLDAIVTLPEKTELAIIETETALIVKQTIETTKPYEGIAKLPDAKFVASCCLVGNESVDIIDIGGQILKCIEKNNSGEAIFSWPRFLSTTPSGNILVSDRDKRSLLCLDQNGTIKWTFPASSSPWGVSCHEDGLVYLCLDNTTVQVLSEAGRLLQNKFITARDGIRVPYSIHAQGDHVALTEWGSSLFAPNSPWVHVFST